MIGVKKSTVKKREKKRTASFRSFGEKMEGAGNLFPQAYLNCDCRGGVLRGGLGAKPYLDANGNPMRFEVPNAERALHVFLSTMKNDSASTEAPSNYIVGVNSVLYQRNDETGAAYTRIHIGTKVDHNVLKTETGEIYNIFCGDRVYATLDGQTYKLVYTEKNAGSCICGKRWVTVSETGTLFYTAPLDLFKTDSSDPNNQGKIYMPSGYGVPVGIKEYDGKVYVFFERGIFKVTLSAFAAEHKIVAIPYYGEVLCLRAQVVTSDGIIFLARDGAYYLRNDSVQKICEHLPIGPCSTVKRCNVAQCEDLAMFHYHQTTEGGTTPKRLVVYKDGKDGYFTETHAVFGGNEYTFKSGTIYYYAKDCEGIERMNAPSFTTRGLDFGTDKKKRLKELRLTGTGKVTVGVQSGEKENLYTLVFKDGVAKARLLDKGRNFVFTFYLDPQTAVKGMDVDYITGE
ncbi:MAG: hypothetical protein J6K86_06010 [Clostridia bacterium]|nr:hypothetical protein [Clostridia bacterium]